MTDSVAFVVMPFDRKRTESTVPGVPAEIDFDALWQQVQDAQAQAGLQSVLERLEALESRAGAE